MPPNTLSFHFDRLRQAGLAQSVEVFADDAFTINATVGVFGLFAQDLTRAFQPGHGFRELGPDGHDLEDRTHQEPEQDGVGEEAAQGQVAGQDLARSHEGGETS